METRPQSNHVTLPLVAGGEAKCTFKTPTIINVRNYRTATREISAAADGYDEKLEALKQANTDKSNLEQKMKGPGGTAADAKELKAVTEAIALLSAELDACDKKSYERLCKRLFGCINVPNNEETKAKREFADIDWENTSIAEINEASGFFVSLWSGAKASIAS